ncbi:MAG: secretin and TonB N-terminal domain-containing protein [Candidatus Omnitrophica bacterium]|nr:secretin and TonB N-terminal domain-containing protein [Candidatus Omnitrophota bacterium]
MTKIKFFSIICLCLYAVNFSLASETTITLDVKDMEITDVIRMIADQSGLNIITSKNVKGLVTINLQNIPVERALDAILKVNNCGYIKEGNIIQVYTLPELNQKEQFAQLFTRVYRLKYVKATDIKQTLLSLKTGRGRLEVEPKTNTVVVTDTEEGLRAIEDAIKEMDKRLETRVFRLNYAKPLELQKSLQSIIPANEGEFLIDERTNSLIVSASPLLLDKIEAIIENWDRQIPQVLIEAKILQITLEKARLIGVDWKYQDTKKHSLSLGVTNLPLPSGVTAFEAFRIGVLTQDEYTAAIEALEATTDTNLISSPRIVTLDNTEAKILIGSSEPYEVFHYDSEGRITGKEVKFIEVGIKLTVTPKISQDGFVTLNIRPEVSSPRTGTAATDTLAIDTTEANAVMTIKDGNTLVMGGLIKDEKQEVVAKIPILGDIPILKYLFRNKYTKTVKKEIVIFITPRIVSPGRIGESVDVNLMQKEQDLLKQVDEKLRKPLR